MNKKENKKNNKGFSLVELIVVIAIMAVLIGVLAPTILKNIEKARYSKDVQALDGIYTAVQSVMADEAASQSVTLKEYTLKTFKETSNKAAKIVNETLADEFFDALVSKAFGSIKEENVIIYISGSDILVEVPVATDYKDDYDDFSSGNKAAKEGSTSTGEGQD